MSIIPDNVKTAVAKHNRWLRLAKLQLQAATKRSEAIKVLSYEEYEEFCLLTKD